MARNQRLADAIAQRGWDLRRFAEEVGVDAKTAERWVGQGRLPHPRLRDRSAACVGVPAGVLWPAAAAPAVGIGELVALYPTRAEMAPATVRSLVAGAGEHIDVLAYAATWLWDAVPRFADTLVAKLDAGCDVRVCLGDPDSAAVALRGEEEGIGDAMAARCRLALTYATPLVRARPGAVRRSDRVLYASLLRFDDEVLVNTHLWGNPAACSPVLHLRRAGDKGMATAALGSFERVWAAAQPVAA